MSWYSVDSEIESLERRHAGHHHTVNIKYGYVILALSIVHMVLSISGKKLYFKNWAETGRASSWWRSVVSIPFWVSTLVWLAIFAFLSIFHIEELSENYTTAVKRLGRMAYCLVPFTIFISLRPPNTVGYQSGYYLEKLNLHKWISRLIFATAIGHGLGFLYKWTKEGALAEKIFKFDNFLGVTVFALMPVLIFASVNVMRRRNYRLFYILHNVTLWMFVVLIAFHARPGVPLLAVINLALLGYQIYQRFFKSYYLHDILVVESPYSKMQIIRIPRPETFPSYLPGSHIRLGYLATNISAWLYATHPFTIASTNDDSESTLDLVMNKPVNFPIDITSPYTMTGPFPSLPPQFYTTARHVNIICGGSGISFGLPIYKYFVNSNRSIPIRLIWCIRSLDDTFILDHLLPERSIDVQIYITSNTGSLNQQQSASTIFDEEADALLEGDSTTNIEMANLATDKEEKKTDHFNTIHDGRPNFDDAFGNLAAAVDVDEKWLIACGPRKLIDDCRKWTKGKDIEFYSELYEM